MAERRSDAVRAAIGEAIRDHGPISFAEFMDLALYGRGGYFERPPIGPAGDFVTSPHVHPVFGQLLADAVRELVEALRGSGPVDLIEVGAGDGTLMRQILPELQGPDLRALAVERSAGSRRSLGSIDGLAVLTDLPDVASGPSVIVAHEVLDNLPFRRFVGTSDGVREVRVTMDAERFVESFVAPGPERGPTFTLDPGREWIEPTGARRFVDRAFDGGDASYLLIIDYGSEGEDPGPVHGYRKHRLVSDVLDRPGETDITAGVPFHEIRRIATEHGLQAFPTVSQRAALKALGIDAWMSSSLERQADLMNSGRGREAVRMWEGRNRASTLVDPVGLGRFTWLVVATQGLPAPAWLTRAFDLP